MTGPSFSRLRCQSLDSLAQLLALLLAQGPVGLGDLVKAHPLSDARKLGLRVGELVARSLGGDLGARDALAALAKRGLQL